jgi:hypothetical protein
MQLFSIRSHEWSLRPWPRAVLFLLALGLPVFFLSAKVLRVGAADTLATSYEIGRLRRAVSLDPDNAKAHRILGSLLCTLEDPHLAEGLEHLHRATELSPNEAVNWSALASACELTADTRCADEAIEHALRLGPMVPRSEWAAANHFLVTDRTDEALVHFQRLLRLDPGYDWQTFRLCLRATGDPDLVLQKVLAPLGDTKLELSYVNYLSAQGEMDSARRAWTASVAHASPFPLSLAGPYLARLLEMGQGREVRSLWQDLEKLGVVTKPAPDEADNLVFNGDFEQTPLNEGLDWRYQPVPYLLVDFADHAASHGKRCLRLDFTVGRNDNFVGASQFVPVAPARNYVVKAYARSQSISSDSGPRLRVVDPSCPSCVNVLSETTVGTTPWHEISLRFTAGPETQLVDISVVRLKSRSFPTEITGTFWLDDVTLKDAASANQEVVSRQAP